MNRILFVTDNNYQKRTYIRNMILDFKQQSKMYDIPLEIGTLALNKLDDYIKLCIQENEIKYIEYSTIDRIKSIYSVIPNHLYVYDKRTYVRNKKVFNKIVVTHPTHIIFLAYDSKSFKQSKTIQDIYTICNKEKCSINLEVK